MSDHNDGNKGASPEDIRHSLRGWALFIALTTAIFGVAYVLIEL